jgi:hypothetical protein
VTAYNTLGYATKMEHHELDLLSHEVKSVGGPLVVLPAGRASEWRGIELESHYEAISSEDYWARSFAIDGLPLLAIWGPAEGMFWLPLSSHERVVGYMVRVVASDEEYCWRQSLAQYIRDPDGPRPLSRVAEPVRHRFDEPNQFVIDATTSGDIESRNHSYSGGAVEITIPVGSYTVHSFELDSSESNIVLQSLCRE